MHVQVDTQRRLQPLASPTRLGATYLLTHLLTYLLTYSLTCLLAYSLTCLFTYLLTYLLQASPTRLGDRIRLQRRG